MLIIYVFLIVMSSIIGSVGGLGLMTTMSLNVLERRREMGCTARYGCRRRTDDRVNQLDHRGAVGVADQ